jgi:3-oxoacyl-[acyl-carrier protein] reductase
VIIVTGASGGLGQPLLESLSGGDEEIVGVYNANPPQGVGKTTRLFQVDVLDEESVRRFAEAVLPGASRITLVNLAGVSHSKLAIEIEAGEWDRVVGVSLKGSFLMSRALLRTMIRAKWGRIINVSSVVAREGVVGTAAYAAGKAGLHGLTRTLATEYARYGILVNTLVLGYLDGGMTNTLSEERRKAVLSRIPLRRFGEVSEIAEAVKFLIRSNYVTGATIRIDGGMP